MQEEADATDCSTPTEYFLLDDLSTEPTAETYITAIDVGGCSRIRIKSASYNHLANGWKILLYCDRLLLGAVV